MRQHEYDNDSTLEYVASANECTGLVPALGGDDAEEARRALYAVKPARHVRRLAAHRAKPGKAHPH